MEDPIGPLDTEDSQFATASDRQSLLVEYDRCFRDPQTLHATCEDDRAGASIELRHDEADLERKVGCPMLALRGKRRRWTFLEENRW